MSAAHGAACEEKGLVLSMFAAWWEARYWSWVSLDFDWILLGSSGALNGTAWCFFGFLYFSW